MKSTKGKIFLIHIAGIIMKKLTAHKDQGKDASLEIRFITEIRRPKKRIHTENLKTKDNEIQGSVL